MAPTAELVDTKALLQAVWVGAAAGIGITISYSPVVLGTTRFNEARHARRRLPMAGYALIAGVGALVTLAAIVLGFVVMTNK